MHVWFGKWVFNLRFHFQFFVFIFQILVYLKYRVLQVFGKQKWPKTERFDRSFPKKKKINFKKRMPNTISYRFHFVRKWEQKTRSENGTSVTWGFWKKFGIPINYSKRKTDIYIILRYQSPNMFTINRKYDQTYVDSTS